MAVVPKALQQAFDALNARIDAALNQALRNRSGLVLVAVSKHQPLSLCEKAYQLGIRHFGENQIQEAGPKIKALPDDIIWHLVGTLQKNKVRKAVKSFHYLHSIDSLSLLQRVDILAGEERVCPKVFLQVNYALDPDKHGFHPDAVEPVLESARGLKNLKCIGLMGIPPLHASPEKIEAYFRGMADMRNKLRERFPEWEGKLSLGMSGDFEQAILAGSHFIRIGSALFGERS